MRLLICISVRAGACVRVSVLMTGIRAWQIWYGVRMCSQYLNSNDAGNPLSYDISSPEPGLCVCVCARVCVSIGSTEHTDRGLARVGLTKQIRTKKCVCVCVCVCADMGACVHVCPLTLAKRPVLHCSTHHLTAHTAFPRPTPDPRTPRPTPSN